MNGCYVLVTTVPCLEKLLDHKLILDNDKFKYLAIENLDDLMDRYGARVRKIIDRLAFNKNKSRQLMITSHIWDRKYQQFLDEDTCDAVLLIGNFCEAAIYANHNIKWQMCKNEEKLQKLFGKFHWLNLVERTNE